MSCAHPEIKQSDINTSIVGVKTRFPSEMTRQMCIILWQHPASGFPRFYTTCKHNSEVLPPVSCDSSLPLCLTPVCKTIFMCIKKKKKAVEPKDSSLPHGEWWIICQQMTHKNFQTSKKSPQFFSNCAATGLDVVLAVTAGLFMHLYGDLAVDLCRLPLWPPGFAGWNSSAVQSPGHVGTLTACKILLLTG